MFYSYFKLVILFILIEFGISFITGLLNILFLSKSLSYILLFIINLIIFFFYGFIRGLNTNKKAVIEGIITSLILICILFIISLIFNSLNSFTIVYYFMLIISTIIGALIAKNKKEASLNKN